MTTVLIPILNSMVLQFNVISYNTCCLTSHCIVGPQLECLLCLANVEECDSTHITTAFSGTSKYHNVHNEEDALHGFLLRAGTRVIYPAMAIHVPGYRPDGRSFF